VHCRSDRNARVAWLVGGPDRHDLAGSARLYDELFGLVNGGGALIWGPPMAIQGLESSARGAMQWLVGSQPFRGRPLSHPDRALAHGPGVTDQGLVNVALGARSVAPVEAALARVVTSGCRTTPAMRFGEAMGTYIVEVERELELIALPAELDARWGFAPAAPFLGAASHR
jgi:hypothetical protein